jgi:hypothetical protein
MAKSKSSTPIFVHDDVPSAVMDYFIENGTIPSHV